MRELFASTDEFNLKEFIALNEKVPLDKLALQLEEISVQVQNEMFSLISGDLVHFQNVLKEVCSGDLDAIRQFRTTLEAVKLKKEDKYITFKEYFDDANKHYQRLTYIQKKKDLTVRLEKARQYIEIFKQRHMKAVESIYELAAMVKNYNWILKFTTEYSIDLEAESDLYSELSNYSERMQDILEIHLKNIIISKEKRDLVVLLKLCQELNKLNLFEASFKLSCVYPSLESFLSVNLDGESNASLLNFKYFIGKVHEFTGKIKCEWNELLFPFYEDMSKFWIRTLLSPILAWIIERCSSNFSPVPNLNEFKSNFEAGLEFVAHVETEFFTTESELLSFRSQSSWVNFMKKWSLHQYYQMRVKKIIGPIEDALRSGLELKALDRDAVLLDTTRIIISSLKEFWSDEVVLRPLIPKFLKVTIQVFRRFIDYSFEEAKCHRNPRIFLITSNQKQYNLEQFVVLVEEELGPSLVRHLDALEEGLEQKILFNLKEECTATLLRMREGINPGIEVLYDSVMGREEEIRNFNLEALKHLKDTSSIRPLIQRILLKFNRSIFKMIDEGRLKMDDYPFYLEKMKHIEGEAKEFGYPELQDEEFWLEIKASLQCNNIKNDLK